MGPNGRDRASAVLPGDTRRPVSPRYPHRPVPPGVIEELGRAGLGRRCGPGGGLGTVRTLRNQQALRG